MDRARTANSSDILLAGPLIAGTSFWRIPSAFFFAMTAMEPRQVGTAWGLLFFCVGIAKCWSTRVRRWVGGQDSLHRICLITHVLVLEVDAYRSLQKMCLEGLGFARRNCLSLISLEF